MTVYAARSVSGRLTFDKPLKEILSEIKPGGGIKILDPEECISEQQSKWLHCKGGPIQNLVNDGWEFETAKRFLKVTHGRKIFVRDMTDKNCKRGKGVFFWECRVASCHKLVFPWEAMHSVVLSRRICPYCLQPGLFPIILKSINQIAPSRIKFWFDTIIDTYDGVLPPNPELKKK
jgi:hypothetical protein